MERTSASPESYKTYSTPPDHQSLESRAGVGHESDEQSQLNEVIERRYRHWPTSIYTDVHVLLLKWAEDNLGVISEVQRLEETFKSRFKFATEIWSIPSEEPEDELTAKLVSFRKGKQQGSLMILYYAGHGGGGPHECIWSATNARDAPSLNWHNVQGLLLGHPPDLLLILDCCYAGLAVSNKGTGNNWFLGASVKESQAIGVSWKSFTSAMTRKLEGAADRFWSEKEPYHVQMLKSDLNLWEQYLPVSPDLTQLTPHIYRPIDLTPLKYPRQRPKLASVTTGPVSSETTQVPQSSPPPKRPQKTFTMPPQPPSGATSTTSNEPVKINSRDTQTLRISGLPWDAAAEDVSNWLKNKMKPELSTVQIGPIVGFSSKTTVATFPNAAVAERALQIERNDFPNRTGTHRNLVEIDSSFQGFTTMYSSSQAPYREQNLDIVLVHGAFGHPVNSFASHYTSPSHRARTVERFWPRDELPELLEAGGVFPRILTYGWPAETWLKPNQDVSSYLDSFLSQLRDVRQTVADRPLVFIAHGVGGFLIKEAVNNIINAGCSEIDFQNPVKTCLFLAVPHREVAANEGFAGILAGMKTMLLGEEPFNHSNVRELQPLNVPLCSISAEFYEICTEYPIGLLSVGESLKTNDNFIVPASSAYLTEAPESRIETDGNHHDVARLPDTVGNRQEVLHRIAEHITKRVVPRKRSIPSNQKERVYARLRKYDTVFLVDDSTSMGGYRWKTAAKVLADVASIAVKYDRNGVDLRFLNEYLEDDERKNLVSADQVMDLFSRVTPNGPTLTADILEEELSEYMHEYTHDRHKKSLNLIVLTDGEPEPGQKVEDVIVKYANKLRDADAHPFQVGIQFVQIGNDTAAARFLKFLDDKLKGEHGLDRDMVDTVRWAPGDEDWLFEKILLGGILKKIDDDDNE
ncbi:MAG: hypothetical protein Q9201_001155 [Fulgogasparrea decipioides]